MAVFKSEEVIFSTAYGADFYYFVDTFLIPLTLSAQQSG
jgi:hypothetical protein